MQAGNSCDLCDIPMKGLLDINKIGFHFLSNQSNNPLHIEISQPNSADLRK